MKKILYFILAAALLLTACSGNQVSDPGKAEDTSAVITIATEAPAAEEPATETTAPEVQMLPLSRESMDFSFLSGAGGWRSNMTLNRDGSFTGMYTDSEMGEAGEGYPYGSVYICAFSGKFVNVEQIDAYSWKMTLNSVETENAVGEEWIQEEIRYVASEPFGLNDPINNQECTEFILYLPDTPVDQLSEDFLLWWPYMFSEEADTKTTLSCYGILNVTTGYGFFTAEA